ncbi:helix-turn-helix domain-containing protein [Compostibacter hankyongensis]|uniref:Helix-turn-helix domain-containing protein n=1 Tax=Compostibacter hankyongensis TaxID=1007089 RepID=A0ABP8FG85_9BACT
MRFETYIPTEQLKPFVKAYAVIESQGEITNRVLPGTSFALAFRIRGQISYLNDNNKTVLPTVAFSGLKKSVRLINYAPHSAAIIVLFKETGASVFFKQPLHELFEQSISLDNFFSSLEISLVEERLAESESLASKITVVEEFLFSKIIHHNPDKLVSEAIAKIYSAKGNIRIKELANDLYISQDAFEKRFRKRTGATPKQFSYIVKMNAVIRQSKIDTPLLDVAFENGYYDQPHFNKDFKIFTGQAPTDFFKSASFW